jgi:hypothetical protein
MFSVCNYIYAYMYMFLYVYIHMYIYIYIYIYISINRSRFVLPFGGPNLGDGPSFETTRCYVFQIKVLFNSLCVYIYTYAY